MKRSRLRPGNKFMNLLLLTSICVTLIILLAILAAGIFLLVRAGARDTVSTAREDWITRRSDKDGREW
jgi:hypothetical protein